MKNHHPSCLSFTTMFWSCGRTIFYGFLVLINLTTIRSLINSTNSNAVRMVHPIHSPKVPPATESYIDKWKKQVSLFWITPAVKVKITVGYKECIIACQFTFWTYINTWVYRILKSKNNILIVITAVLFYSHQSSFVTVYYRGETCKIMILFYRCAVILLKIIKLAK